MDENITQEFSTNESYVIHITEKDYKIFAWLYFAGALTINLLDVIIIGIFSRLLEITRQSLDSPILPIIVGFAFIISTLLVIKAKRIFKFIQDNNLYSSPGSVTIYFLCSLFLIIQQIVMLLAVFGFFIACNVNDFT